MSFVLTEVILFYSNLKSIFNCIHIFSIIKNVLLPRTSHVKGLHVPAKFLPLLDDWTWVLQGVH